MTAPFVTSSYMPGEAHGSLLAPLDDAAYFSEVSVDAEARSVVWPNGLDLVPEVLHGDNETRSWAGVPRRHVGRQPA